MHTNRKDTAALTCSSSCEGGSVFLRACRLEPVERTPIWLMRQAGRFMPEYRAIREKVAFLELCKSPQLAAEVTVMAVDQLRVDAGIIFADILLPLEPLGVGLEFAKGDGPKIHRPVRSAADESALNKFDVASELGYVFESVRQAVKGLGDTPLIGFAGAPFTLASYLIEGGSSRNFENTKAFMYKQPAAWHRLMERLAQITIDYLNGQIAAGAQVVQLFDSWVGCLSPHDYERYVAPHMVNTISGITSGVPVIHFGTGTATLLKLMQQAGGDVIGLDWRVELGATWSALGFDTAVQGNLDPVILLSDESTIREQTERVLQEAGGRAGHIFNIGHGILPSTPVQNVKYLVETVRELSSSKMTTAAPIEGPARL